MGRRSKASEARVEALLIALRAGNTRAAAAAHAEIDRTTLHRWLGRDPGLQARVVKAEADAEVRFGALIAQAASVDWRAATWWLEHRRPADYGRGQMLAAATPAASVVVPSAHPLDDLSFAEQARRAREWLARLDAEAAEDLGSAAGTAPG